MAGVAVGVVHEPILGETHCGDAYLVLDEGATILVAVADGLGHGKEAEEASQAAMAYIRAHATMALGLLLEGCHRRLSNTRGAVLSIARIDRAAHTLLYAGVGNIEARIVAAEKTYRPIPQHGIVGHTLRKTRCEEFPFAPGDLLVMHSDGISDRFEISALGRERDVQLLANQIGREAGKHHDDQLLLILKDVP